MQTLITMMEKYLENNKGQEEGQDGENGEEGHTGVKLDIRNDENKTPLHLAALKGHLE